MMLSNFFDDVHLTDLPGAVTIPPIAAARVDIHQGPSAAVGLRMVFPSLLPWEIGDHFCVQATTVEFAVVAERAFVTNISQNIIGP